MVLHFYARGVTFESYIGNAVEKETLHEAFLTTITHDMLATNAMLLTTVIVMAVMKMLGMMMMFCC